jgi:hypothetical protein
MKSSILGILHSLVGARRTYIALIIDFVAAVATAAAFHRFGIRIAPYLDAT